MKHVKFNTQSLTVKQFSRCKKTVQSLKITRIKTNHHCHLYFLNKIFQITSSENLGMLFLLIRCTVKFVSYSINSNQHNLKFVKMQQQGYRYMKDQRKNKQQSTKILTNENMIQCHVIDKTYDYVMHNLDLCSHSTQQI